MGTRFLVAKECTVHEAYKERVLKASDIDTVVTGRTTGHPVRGIRNQLTREYFKLEKEGATVEELDKLGTGALYRAVVEGDVTTGAVMAGQSAGLVTKVQSAEEIILEIMKELKAVIGEKVQLIN
jgi:enoyl-[acyl-carrier protein] reductase II